MNPLHHIPQGPAQVADLQRQINDLKEEIRQLQPQPSPTVFPHKTAVGTTWEVVPATRSTSSTSRQVWL